MGAEDFIPCEKCSKSFPCESAEECIHIEPARAPLPGENENDFYVCGSCGNAWCTCQD